MTTRFAHALRGTTVAAALAAAALAGSAHAATVSSHFDSGLDGWTTFGNEGPGQDGTSNLSNAGGYLHSVDFTDTWGWLLAPAAFTNAARSALGGDFSFDLRSLNNGDLTDYPVRVVLRSGGQAITATAFNPTSTFGSYSFSFDDSSTWRFTDASLQDPQSVGALASAADIQAVLGSLTGIFIAADYSGANSTVGGFDHTDLDNVTLVTEPAAVPEPAGLALAALGLGALALRRRRA